MIYGNKENAIHLPHPQGSEKRYIKLGIKQTNRIIWSQPF